MTSCYHDDVIVDSPITIGTYPIMDSQLNFTTESSSIGAYSFPVTTVDTMPPIVDQPTALGNSTNGLPAAVEEPLVTRTEHSAVAEMPHWVVGPAQGSSNAAEIPDSPFPIDG